MIGLSDTSPDVERRMYDIYRNMPAWRKWKNHFDDYRTARSLHAAGMRMRQPGATNLVIQAKWIQLFFGDPCPVAIPESLEEPSRQDVQPVFCFAIETLERTGIEYAVAGSIASSLHGVNRMTTNADFSVEPFPSCETAFITAFNPNEFYLSPESVRDALRTRSTFKILHPATGYKINIFVCKDEPFERAAFTRRVPFPMPGVPEQLLQLHSPEDIILFKLRWFRMGGETSEKQWTHIHGVLMTQGERLDIAYLDHWAAEIGVKDLLDRARSECSLQ